ncbi:MAG: helix-turn-helix domain-containing protein [Leucobacter sp.]|nr:helix-turn-helix domain-containing protein [Leucobacter sp.]
MVSAARSGGLAHILGSLRSALSAEVAFFDLTGNVLSSAPARTLWDFERVLAVHRSADASAPLTVLPVDIDGDTVGLLAARATDDPQQLLPVAIDLLALEISKLRAKQSGQAQLLATLLEDIFTKRVSDADAAARLAPFGIDGAARHRVLVGWDPTAGPGRRQLSWGSIDALVQDRPDPLMRARIGDQIVMVVPDDAMVQRIAETLHAHLLGAGRGGDPSSVRVGVGLAHAGTAGLRASYHEALTAVHEGGGVRSPKRVDLAGLFVMTNTADSLRDLAKSILGPLIDYDRVHNSDLLRTLQVFLRNNRSIQATTEALYVHRNTLRYRRGQIEQLLDMDLDDSAHIANLWLAFAILDDANIRDGE